jgi:hypothetical protein
MKWRACAGALLALLSSYTEATGLSDAFSSGQALGSAGVASAQGAITAGQGTNVVPNYTGAAPESSYFAGGQGTLFAPATGKVSNCATGPRASTAYAQQDCDAVNFLARNPSVRPQINLGKNDPLVTGAKTILANPQALAGSMTGSYSACSTATVNQPAAYDTEVCNQYTNMTQSTCQKTLNVTVTNDTVYELQNRTWTPPLGAYGHPLTTYDDLRGGPQSVCNVLWPGSTAVYASCASVTPPGGCDGLHNGGWLQSPYCSDQGWCTGHGIASITCRGSVLTTKQTITKSWDDQCSTLESLAQ